MTKERKVDVKKYEVMRLYTPWEGVKRVDDKIGEALSTVNLARLRAMHEMAPGLLQEIVDDALLEVEKRLREIHGIFVCAACCNLPTLATKIMMDAKEEEEEEKKDVR